MYVNNIMGNSAGKVIGNLAILAVKTIGTVISVAGAIASEGLTAPIAALSYASTASSWYDFIKNPTGNVNRSIINGAEWIGKTIGSASGEQVISAINTATNLDPFTSTASSLGLDTVITKPRVTETAVSIARSRITAAARAAGINTANAGSITSIISSGVRQMNMARGNRVDRLRSQLVRVAGNAVTSSITAGSSA